MSAKGLSVFVTSIVLLHSGETWAQPESQGGESTILLDNGESISIAGEEVIIKGERIRSEAAQVVLDAKESAALAGVQGDALKAVRTLGGVARTPAGSQGLSVWGAAPSDTQLYVDDIPIPRLFHLGGNRSVLPTHEIDSLRLIPGGASARFGRAIGGAVEVQTSQPGQKPIEFLFHLDPFDVGLHASSRLSDDSWISLSTRASLLPVSLSAVAPKEVEELVPVPDTLDYQARGGHRLPNGDTIRILALGSSDHLERGIPSLQLDQAFTETKASDFSRVGISLLREKGRITRKVSAWAGLDRESQDLQFGDVVAFGESEKRSVGLLLVQDVDMGANWDLRFGVDGQFARSRFARKGALTLPSREGDVFVFGQAPGNRINEDNWQVDAGSLGVFLTADIRPTDWLRIQPGFRFEPNIVRGNRVLPARPSEAEVGYSDLQISADPRLRISVNTEMWQLYTALGRYHQAASPEDLSPVFGSPILTQEKAWQILLGADLDPTSKLHLSIVTFASKQENLSVRSALATPAIAGLLRSTGEGENIGAQLSVRIDLRENMYGSLSYSAMQARRRSDSQSPWRRFDSDQRHFLRWAAHWKHGSGVSLGGRFELSSGLPRTPVEGSIFNATSQSFDPIFGAHNSDDLGLFSELSLRVGYEQTSSWGAYSLWLDAINVTNRQNVEEVFYSSDFSSSGSVLGLPILAVLGAELRL